MKLLNDEYDIEKHQLQSLVDELELKLKTNNNRENDLRKQFIELESSWKTMLENPDENKRQLSYNILK